MTYEELTEIEGECDAEIRVISERRLMARDQYSKEHSPFQIGDYIQWSDGNRMIRGCVKTIAYQGSRGRFDYVVIPILKDGSDGISRMLYSWDAKKATKVNQ